MTLHFQLALFLWAAMVVIVGQGLFLTWIMWPRLRRHLYCPWCWHDLHIGRWFPESWSATICVVHERRILTQLAVRSAIREARARAALAETVEPVQEVTV